MPDTGPILRMEQQALRAAAHAPPAGGDLAELLRCAAELEAAANALQAIGEVADGRFAAALSTGTGDWVKGAVAWWDQNVTANGVAASQAWQSSREQAMSANPEMARVINNPANRGSQMTTVQAAMEALQQGAQFLRSAAASLESYNRQQAFLGGEIAVALGLGALTLGIGDLLLPAFGAVAGGIAGSLSAWVPEGAAIGLGTAGAGALFGGVAGTIQAVAVEPIALATQQPYDLPAEVVKDASIGAVAGVTAAAGGLVSGPLGVAARTLVPGLAVTGTEAAFDGGFTKQGLIQGAIAAGTSGLLPVGEADRVSAGSAGPTEGGPPEGGGGGGGGGISDGPISPVPPGQREIANLVDGAFHDAGLGKVDLLPDAPQQPVVVGGPRAEMGSGQATAIAGGTNGHAGVTSVGGAGGSGLRVGPMREAGDASGGASAARSTVTLADPPLAPKLTIPATPQARVGVGEMASDASALTRSGPEVAAAPGGASALDQSVVADPAGAAQGTLRLTPVQEAQRLLSGTTTPADAPAATGPSEPGVSDPVAALGPSGLEAAATSTAATGQPVAPGRPSQPGQGVPPRTMPAIPIVDPPPLEAKPPPPVPVGWPAPPDVKTPPPPDVRTPPPPDVATSPPLTVSDVPGAAPSPLDAPAPPEAPAGPPGPPTAPGAPTGPPGTPAGPTAPDNLPGRPEGSPGAAPAGAPPADPAAPPPAPGPLQPLIEVPRVVDPPGSRPEWWVDYPRDPTPPPWPATVARLQAAGVEVPLLPGEPEIPVPGTARKPGSHGLIIAGPLGDEPPDDGAARDAEHDETSADAADARGEKAANPASQQGQDGPTLADGPEASWAEERSRLREWSRAAAGSLSRWREELTRASEQLHRVSAGKDPLLSGPSATVATEALTLLVDELAVFQWEVHTRLGDLARTVQRRLEAVCVATPGVQRLADVDPPLAEEIEGLRSNLRNQLRESWELLRGIAAVTSDHGVEPGTANGGDRMLEDLKRRVDDALDDALNALLWVGGADFVGLEWVGEETPSAPRRGKAGSPLPDDLEAVWARERSRLSEWSRAAVESLSRWREELTRARERLDRAREGQDPVLSSPTGVAARQALASLGADLAGFQWQVQTQWQRLFLTVGQMLDAMRLWTPGVQRIADVDPALEEEIRQFALDLQDQLRASLELLQGTDAAEGSSAGGTEEASDPEPPAGARMLWGEPKIEVTHDGVVYQAWEQRGGWFEVLGDTRASGDVLRGSGRVDGRTLVVQWEGGPEQAIDLGPDYESLGGEISLVVLGPDVDGTVVVQTLWAISDGDLLLRLPEGAQPPQDLKVLSGAGDDRYTLVPEGWVALWYRGGPGTDRVDDELRLLPPGAMAGLENDHPIQVATPSEGPNEVSLSAVGGGTFVVTRAGRRVGFARLAGRREVVWGGVVLPLATPVPDDHGVAGIRIAQQPFGAPRVTEVITLPVPDAPAESDPDRPAVQSRLRLLEALPVRWSAVEQAIDQLFAQADADAIEDVGRRAIALRETLVALHDRPGLEELHRLFEPLERWAELAGAAASEVGRLESAARAGDSGAAADPLDGLRRVGRDLASVEADIAADAVVVSDQGLGMHSFDMILWLSERVVATGLADRVGGRADDGRPEEPPPLARQERDPPAPAAGGAGPAGGRLGERLEELREELDGSGWEDRLLLERAVREVELLRATADVVEENLANFREWDDRRARPGFDQARVEERVEAAARMIREAVPGQLVQVERAGEVAARLSGTDVPAELSRGVRELVGEAVEDLQVLSGRLEARLRWALWRMGDPEDDPASRVAGLYALSSDRRQVWWPSATGKWVPVETPSDALRGQLERAGANTGPYRVSSRRRVYRVGPGGARRWLRRLVHPAPPEGQEASAEPFDMPVERIGFGERRGLVMARGGFGSLWAWDPYDGSWEWISATHWGGARPDAFAIGPDRLYASVAGRGTYAWMGEDDWSWVADPPPPGTEIVTIDADHEPRSEPRGRRPVARRVVRGKLRRVSAPLRADVRRLSSALGELIAESGGPGLLEDVERLRKATIALREARGPDAATRLARIVEFVGGFDLARAEAVARAFTVYFQLVNLAEERHRVRVLRRRSRSTRGVAESLTGTVEALREEVGDTGVTELIAGLEVRPVLTAHPTEARRRAVLDALRRISRAMDLVDDRRLSASEHADAERQLSEQISILWRTSQLRRQRPSPLDEVRSVMSIFDESLFTLVPVLYRELQRAVARAAPGVDAGRTVPPILRWGSWVGGDRDGNPNVTAEVTEATLEIQAEHVLRGLETAARRIGRSLTLSEESTPPSEEARRSLRQASEAVGSPGNGAAAHSLGELHREFLLLMADRLRATRLDSQGRYPSADAFVADLRTLQESLRAAGASRVADGELQHLIWQAETFGFHLASLEIRQHSAVHRQALSELVPGAEDEAAALDAIAGDPPPGATPRSEAAREVLATMRVIARLQARYGVESCRRYVVSFTRSAADVVAVTALARLAVPEGTPEIDVVPLFESRADLEAAPRVLDELLQLPGWRAWLDRRGRRLEVMLGYSDATKDAGFLAANLALYRAQSALVAWARRNRVELTLFHGRGGAVGRGGGRTGRAIRSQAPGSVSGRFKVTEQGEVISARYSNPAIARRHLEQVTSAVLTASTAGHEAGLAAAEARFFEAAQVMARASEAAYRGLVESPGFAEFFARVTPLDEIGRLGLGSRPARRRAGGTADLDQLRAIPWVFAWTQSRCNLPGWFGLGTGLDAIVRREGLPYLRRMVAEWPFLASIVENAEMSLAKADPMIAGLYLRRGGRPDLVDVIREEYRLTRRLVHEVTGNERLLAGHPILRLAVDLRNPYVDALSFLQLRFLGELGEAEGPRAERLSELVRLTIGGIAAGLQNTG